MSYNPEWSKRSNSTKTEQLGMSYNRAYNELRKKVIFHLMVKCGMDTCFKCGEKITRPDDMSIEHIEPWLYADNPLEVFHDMNNIAFSHFLCNMSRQKVLRGNGTPASGYKGVTHKNVRGKWKWRAQFYNGITTKHIGYFDTPEEGAIAYDNAVITCFGEDAVTNKSLGLINY